VIGREGNVVPHDLVIRGGTVVDGTGAPPRTADVAIDGGVVTEVGQVGDSGRRELDADGATVTPGWVDIHTHYDGQVTWDSELAPSSHHGVTTVVAGNCGVGFAPASPDRHDWLIGLMEGVEDIPGTALAEGITWQWETFPEYLDSLDGRRWTMDVGTQIAHGAVRAYVMGERGARNEPATTDDIAAMAAIVRDAIQAGALGFSTSRTIAHRAIDGEPVPGTFAAEDELFGIGAVLGELGAGVFELAPTGSAGEDVVAPVKEVDWMRRLAAEIGRPVTFGLLQVDAAPDLWRELLDVSAAALADGTPLVPQVPGRPTGVLGGFDTTYCFLDAVPAYVALAGRTALEKVAYLRTAEGRAAVLDWDPDPETAARLTHAAERSYVLGDPPDYEPGPEATIAAIAARQGCSVLEVALDAMLADDGHGLVYVPILNYSDGNSDANREMLLHPAAVLGLADGGAHVGTICDASMPTWMLTHWVRDRTRGERLPLEFVVRRQTQDTARLYGLGDRGVLLPGAVADVNLIDLDGLQLGSPRVVADLPAGGRRLVQEAEGYVATVKRGAVTFEDGRPTGELPGRLLRGSRPGPAAA
jgi:N-acyl-D-amino-acid deacylase